MTRYADFRLTRDDLMLVIYALRIEEVGCRGRAAAGGTFIAAYESNVAARVACLVTRLEAAADAELAARRAA